MTVRVVPTCLEDAERVCLCVAVFVSHTSNGCVVLPVLPTMSHTVMPSAMMVCLLLLLFVWVIGSDACCD